LHSSGREKWRQHDKLDGPTPSMITSQNEINLADLQFVLLRKRYF